jgi:hypothetical protein
VPHRFTKSFQNSLADTIEVYLDEWLGTNHSLLVELETKPVSDWYGIADISISKCKKFRNDKYSRVLNIEIEHWSCPSQALTNVQHVINWVNLNRLNRASLIQLVNTDSLMSDNACAKVLSCGYDNRSKRFNYDFRVYDIDDARASRIFTQNFCEKYDFTSLLWQHLRFLDFV